MTSVIVKTSLDMTNLLIALKNTDEFVLDVETTGLRPFKGNYPIGYGFYIPKFDTGFYVPVEHITAIMDDNGNITEENHEDNIDEEWFIQKLNETIQPGSNNINFNIKFDYHNYKIAGLDTNLFTIEDVQVAANIYDENELRYSLDILAGKYLGERKETDVLEEAYKLIKDERIIRLKKKKEEYKQLGLDYQVLEIEAQIKYIRAKKAVEHYAELTPDLVGSYCIHDCYITWKLREFYRQELEKQSATKTKTLWDLNIEQREYTQALVEAEHHGILIDPDYCQQEIEFNRSRQDELAVEMQLSLGKVFNPRSNQDIQRILYGTTGLAKFYPADEAAIERAKTPIGLKLKEFKKIEKATGTYFEAFLRFSDSNNYIHPHFNQHRTVSSRLSSSEPNFQNIPRLDEDKLEVKPENRYISRVRHAIIAPEGMLILANDYSQIELRLLAHYSKDPVLMDAYLNDKDVHQMTGDAVGVSRQDGKTLNFAIVYGAGPDKIGSMLGVSQAKGKAIYSEYQQKLPGVWDFVKRVSYHAVKYREVTLWTGRKRRFNHDSQLNSAVNSVIQGGAAEVFRYAITRLYRKFKDDPEAPKFILPIHDDITYYAKENNYKDYLSIIKSEMERWSFSIPIKVDSKIGKRWSEMEKIR